MASNSLILSNFILLLPIATINTPYVKLRILPHSLRDFSFPREGTEQFIAQARTRALIRLNVIIHPEAFPHEC